MTQISKKTSLWDCGWLWVDVIEEVNLYGDERHCASFAGPWAHKVDSHNGSDLSVVSESELCSSLLQRKATQ